MILNKDDWSNAARIVRDAGGRLVGRTKLQKVAYLLELVGLGAGFEFEYKHYGPYSERLSEAIAMANAFGLVEEEERRTDWGGTYSIYTFVNFQGASPAKARAAFVQKAAGINAVELELAATAAYLKVVEHSKNPWEDTKALKPEKATDARIVAAKLAYADLKGLATPKPLPAI